jgi:hypothetical protein
MGDEPHLDAQRNQPEMKLRVLYLNTADKSKTFPESAPRALLGQFQAKGAGLKRL